MKTQSITASEIQKNWFLVDACEQKLGRLASRISQILKGKNKPFYTPHMDMGDCVVVINAEKVMVTGNKEKEKNYWRHTGFPGGQKSISLAELRKKQPENIIYNTSMLSSKIHNSVPLCADITFTVSMMPKIQIFV